MGYTVPGSRSALRQTSKPHTGSPAVLDSNRSRTRIVALVRRTSWISGSFTGNPRTPETGVRGCVSRRRPGTEPPLDQSFRHSEVELPWVNHQLGHVPSPILFRGT